MPLKIEDVDTASQMMQNKTWKYGCSESCKTTPQPPNNFPTKKEKPPDNLFKLNLIQLGLQNVTGQWKKSKKDRC
ncbi:LOW QUALITY PROTEIN: hypothetical protein EUGRSUZ_F04340 [Eucalyptus grandis]|uniref:Uncharacterized protein n=1 Tax=Eucalyptus grandis TaxID=71139 RepID=A0ACC3KPT5_EUCGR|nr:LOW QUALITY PROTEIN: hypothetical protein EUGRSUZ_F04340 [Eucalyptus grandis]